MIGKLWYLKKVNLFKGMSKEEMDTLAQMTQMKGFRKKESLYLPGEPGNYVYLLKKGVVRISKSLPDGHELTLALLKPGEIFGELEVVGEGPRDTQATAHSDALICILGKHDLMRLMESKPALGIRLSKLIGFRRQVLENRLENLIFRSVPQRLAALLLELAQQFGATSPRGIKVNIALTHQDLANLIGASRPTTTEVLNEFKTQKIISISGKSLTVTAPERLKSLA